MVPHLITEDQGSCYIIVIVFKRLVNRLTHCLQACKMDDRLNVLLIKYVL